MSDKQPRRVYLDVCALSRPFDDQSQVRVRLETTAVDLILSHVRAQVLELVASPAHTVEIAAIPDMEKRRQLTLSLEMLGSQPSFDLVQARQRAEWLVTQDLGPADAVHLAFAEQMNADFITTDDHLIHRYQRLSTSLWCGTPPAFCDKENLQ